MTSLLYSHIYIYDTRNDDRDDDNDNNDIFPLYPLIGLSQKNIQVCQTPVRFYAVAKVLAKMVDVLVEFPSIRLLRHVVRCYLRLCDNRLAKADGDPTSFPGGFLVGFFEPLGVLFRKENPTIKGTYLY
jgi:hypothetical protein